MSHPGVASKALDALDALDLQKPKEMSTYDFKPSLHRETYIMVLMSVNSSRTHPLLSFHLINDLKIYKNIYIYIYIFVCKAWDRIHFKDTTGNRRKAIPMKGDRLNASGNRLRTDKLFQMKGKPR